ncbi:MAG: TonB-dependent receptor [Sphingomonas sp.]|jgi:iron complex outermembrane receptor protein|uniref:TonB-dependent receptor n=1 Tax=Sphingomonas sp. TaxID=28214 RepID=UPI003567DB76
MKTAARFSKFRHRTLLIASGMAIATLQAAPAYAQATPAPAAEEPQDQGGLEDIVVTAQKRAQNLQDVPIAITAVTADALATSGAYNVLDLERVAPGLQVYQTGASVLPFLRGIGSNQSSPGFESPVAIYLDGIYQATKSANTFDLPNIERIEVLKGPQGTLFGRNATGGAISIVTRDPDQTPEIAAEIGYGRYDERRAKLYAQTPVTDTLAASISFAGRWSDGYIYNNFLKQDANPSENLIAMGKIVWKPSDAFTARLSGSYYEHNDPTFLAPRVVPGTIPAGTSPTGAGGLPVPEYRIFQMRSNHKTYVTTSGYRSSLELNYDLGPVRVVSLSGYIKAKAGTLSNSPASELSLGYSGSRDQPGEQFTQELQIQSDSGGAVNWIVGGYYGWIREGFADLLSASNLPSPIRPIDLSLPGASATGFHVDMRTNAYAAFAQGDIELTDGLRFTGGLRYNTENHAIDGFRYSYSALPAAGNTNVDLFNTVLGPEPLVFGQTVAASSITKRDKTFSKLTWRAALDYKVSDDVMLYASYNRGFKSGTYNPTSLSTTAVPVDPEILDAYEIGFKSEFLDRRLRVNASAFYYDYTNIQVGLITSAGVTAVQNAAAARVYGLDLDVTAAPTDNLTIRAALNLLDSQYKNYTNAQIFLPKTSAAACTAPPPSITQAQAEALAALPKFAGSCSYSLNANGLDLIFSPKLTANIAADYTIPVGEARVVLTGSLYYNDGYDVTPGGYFAHIGSYESASLAATYYAADDRYSVRLWADNVTNNKHAIYISPQALAFQQVDARPIIYGVTLGVKFRGK